MFQCVMPMAMVFEIVQHQDTFWYATICGGDYWLRIHIFKLRDLCVHVVDDMNYFGCNYGTYFSMCAKGFTSWCVIVGGLKWLDMEGPCV